MPIAGRKTDFATNGVFIWMRKSVRLFLCGTGLACVFPVNAIAADAQIPQAKYRPPDDVTMIELRGTSEAGGLTGRFTMIVDLHSGRYVAQRDRKSVV